MTQDDLWVRLLLLGFYNTDDAFTYKSTQIEFVVFYSILHHGDVNVRYRKHGDVNVRYRKHGDEHLYGFRSSPEAAFNFIKEKLT